MVHFQTNVWKYDPFSNRCLKMRSIFKQMFENTVHFQTCFERIPLAPPPAVAPGRCRALGRGIFQNVFENGPYFQTSVWKWTILGSSYFKIAIGLVFKISSFSRGRKLPPDEAPEQGMRNECIRQEQSARQNRAAWEHNHPWRPHDETTHLKNELAYLI